jgi:hypothetical protein
MTSLIFSKVIAGPTGFYAFCSDRPIVIGNWTELKSNLGPRRKTKSMAEHDIRMMTEVTQPVSTSANTNIFANTPTKRLHGLLSASKHKHKGLRPFFSNPKMQIALREEIDRRS